MIFATAGHVDHGKTSLVKALTGVDTDRLAEEKKRGLTIDLGFAYLHKDNKSIGFVDVPGHSKFITNMLAGVAAIDHALIIVAADDGPMPQTQEHINILMLLGIQQATIVITKTDRVDESGLQNTSDAIKQLTIGTPFADAPVFKVDSINGSGIADLHEHLWRLKVSKSGAGNEYFRLAVDRRFSVKGSGTVVTGSVFSGQISLNDEARLVPGNTSVRVRSLHRQDTDAKQATCGDRCALNLTGDLNLEQVRRGQWVTNHPSLPVSNRLDVEMTLLPGETQAIKTGLPVHIHLAAQHTTGRLFLLDQRHLSPGSTSTAQLVSDHDLSSCFGDRFVLRDQSASRTIAGGRVLDPFSVKKGRSKPGRIAYISYLQQVDDPADIEVGDLLARTRTGINLTQLASAFNRPAFKTGYPTDDMGLSYDENLLNELAEQTITALKQKAMSQSQLKQTLDVRASLMKLVLQRLIGGNKIEASGSDYTLPGQGNQLSPAALKLWQKVQPILNDAGLQPPVIHELAKQLNLPAPALEKLLGACVKQGVLARPVKNRYFLVETMNDLRQLAIDVAEKSGGQFTVIEFRDHTGIGRNLCIELLEHLDSKGFTKRMGDQRIIQDRNR